MQDLTIIDLKAIIGHCQNILREKGYDSIESPAIVVSEHLAFTCHVMDDYQSTVEWNKRYQVGYKNIHFKSPAELYDQLQAIPSREQRELNFMLKETAVTAEMAKNIRSAQARAFVNEVLKAGEHYRNLLTAQ